MSFRKINFKVGVDCKQVEEFSIGDRVHFHDEYTGVCGEGIITAFAQADYEPTIWYETDDGDIGTVHLGWCSKINGGDKQ